jgi:hypothetical protein
VIENVKAILRDAVEWGVSELRREVRHRLRVVVWSLLYEDDDRFEGFGSAEEARLAMVARAETAETAWTRTRRGRPNRALGTWCEKCGIAHAGECS